MKKRNPVLIFNIIYWVSFFVVYLPQYFFPTTLLSKMGVTWFLILGSNIFSFIEPVYYLWIFYGVAFTAIMLSILIVCTRNRGLWIKVSVFVIYLTLNTAGNVILTDW